MSMRKSSGRSVVRLYYGSAFISRFLTQIILFLPIDADTSNITSTMYKKWMFIGCITKLPFFSKNITFFPCLVDKMSLIMTELHDIKSVVHGSYYLVLLLLTVICLVQIINNQYRRIINIGDQENKNKNTTIALLLFLQSFIILTRCNEITTMVMKTIDIDMKNYMTIDYEVRKNNA